MVKERLDRLLVSRGLVEGRRQAYAVIVAGAIKVNGSTCLKPDLKVETEAEIDFEDPGRGYVSRGGLKLAKALEVFQVSVEGLTVMDAGASTGGFTDCLLRQGAAHVIAVDVGYGQLAWKLRQDKRVSVLERVNVRRLRPEQLPAVPTLATIDVSFISLMKVLPAITGCLAENGAVLALVKPQFEIGKGLVGRNGVVRRAEDHVEVLATVGRQCIEQGLSVLGVSYSPILGPKGNIEFWIYLSKKPSVGYAIRDINALAAQIVEQAHMELIQ
jgi:23S rRNA (cytidine1920-2'-O)/16S rRNA (cytidine1409-2'-O)-methyltransferase